MRKHAEHAKKDVVVQILFCFHEKVVVAFVLSCRNCNVAIVINSLLLNYAWEDRLKLRLAHV
jgi:hypothetical protein